MRRKSCRQNGWESASAIDFPNKAEQQNGGLKVSKKKVSVLLCRVRCNKVGVKRSFDTYDTRLLRTSYSRNLQNIRNPLIFL